jgi:hypothetical protein
MTDYEIKVQRELKEWQHKMIASPGFFNSLSKRVQDKINKLIPERVHQAVTNAIKKMINAVLFGAQITSAERNSHHSLELKEAIVAEKIKFYRNTAAAEGGITGAGGILLGLADFPLLLGIKIKNAFEIATVYGFDVDDYKERVIYPLYFSTGVFQSQTSEKYLSQNVRLATTTKKIPGVSGSI